MAKTYKGKSMKPGGGGLFAKMTTGLERKGYGADRAKAIAAAAGRKKYGAAKMAKFASEGKKRAHNTKIDLGSTGEAVPHDEMTAVPYSERNMGPHMAMQPHSMTSQDMYAKADPNHHLHALIQEHAKMAAHHAAQGKMGKEMAEHHRGMARALRAHIEPKIHNGPEYL